MKSENVGYFISDRLGMGWLEMHRIDENSTDGNFEDGKALSKVIRMDFCEQSCVRYNECGGIRAISQPYNRMEVVSRGRLVPIKPAHCCLNNKVVVIAF